MAKRILIVGAGQNQIELIRKARTLELDTVAVDGSPSAPGFSESNHSAVANITLASEIVRVAKEFKVNAIYPAAEWGVEAAAHATTELGLPGITPEVARCVRNKYALRVALEKGGIPGPAYRLVRSLEEAFTAVETIGFPVIVKPSDGNASRGVARVETVGEIRAAVKIALSASRTASALIEAYLDGEEFNVDGLVFQGEYRLGGITGKERSAPPHRFDLGIFMPPHENIATQTAITDHVALALRAIGFHAGTTHAEVIVTKAGPRIVEIAGRPGGGRIPTDLIPLTYGMDYMADALRIALGEPPQELRIGERGTAVYWIPAPPGVVESVEGADGARTMEGVRDVVVIAKRGDRIDPIVDCATRDKVGYVMTQADSAGDAVRLAKAACARIRVRTKS
jgi:biotin carboxylase